MENFKDRKSLTEKTVEKVCCFAGHNLCYVNENLKTKIYNTVERLIVEEGFNVFYDGGQGSFDESVLEILFKLKEIYPHIKIIKVLTYARLGECKYEGQNDHWDDYMVFDYELVYPKARITYRNKCMVEACDVLVCYIIYTFHSGAYNMFKHAQKIGKRIIKLADNDESL